MREYKATHGRADGDTEHADASVKLTIVGHFELTLTPSHALVGTTEICE